MSMTSIIIGSCKNWHVSGGCCNKRGCKTQHLLKHGRSWTVKWKQQRPQKGCCQWQSGSSQISRNQTRWATTPWKAMCGLCWRRKKSTPNWLEAKIDKIKEDSCLMDGNVDYTSAALKDAREAMLQPMNVVILRLSRPSKKHRINMLCKQLVIV